MAEPRNLPFHETAPRREVPRPGRSAVELFEDNIGLAHHLARRYGAGLDLDDALQEALIGLHRAACTFDPARGRFAPMASIAIRRRLHRARCQQREMPIRVTTEVWKLDLAAGRLALELGREATVDELAADRQTTPDRVRWLRAVARPPAELVTDPPSSADSWRDVTTRYDAAVVRRAVTGLKQRHREAVTLHHLDGLDMAAVGRRLGVCREAVRQSVGRALGILRRDAGLVRLARV